MSVTVAEGVVEVTADADGVPGQIGRALDGGAPIIGGAGTRMGGSFFGGFKGFLLGAGITAAIGIGLALGNAVGDGLRSAADYITNSIDLGSDLAETSTAIDALFGPESAAVVESWANNAVRGLGQTSQSALDAAKTFGVFGTAANLQGPELVNFSTNLTGLATDLASFHNTSPEEAIEALGAALRGEMEPIRRYGIIIDDAATRQQALAMGIYDGSGALNAQQRTLAVNALLYEKAGVAVGDFERTSGGLANQQRILSAAWEEAQTRLGTALLPAITTLVTFANDSLMPVFGDLIDQVGPVLADALEKSTPALIDLAEAGVQLIPPLVDLGVNVLPPLIDLLILLMPFLVDWATNTASLWTIINEFVNFLQGETTFEEFAQRILNVGGSTWEMARQVGRFLGETMVNVWNFGQSVKTNIDNAIGFFTSIPGRIQGALVGAATWLYDTGRNIVQGLINGVTGMVGKAVSSVTNLGASMLNGIKNFFGIRSPSVKMDVEVGEQLGAGQIRGYERKMSDWRASVVDSMRMPAGLGDTIAARSAVATSGGGGMSITIGSITLDASSIDDFKRMIDMLLALPQVARAGRVAMS